jgi:hypothetical protein
MNAVSILICGLLLQRAQFKPQMKGFIFILKIIFIVVILLFIPGGARVIMSLMELKMQPTIHVERKAGRGNGGKIVRSNIQKKQDSLHNLIADR